METAGSQIETKQFLAAAAYLLHETFEGSPEGQPSAYLDHGAGFFPTLESLSAEQVSTEFEGTTIAAQTEHAKFYLDRLCEYVDGRTEPVNWDDSWLIETVSETEWPALVTALHNTYERTLACLATARVWTDTQIGMAMGMIAHSAYHLGAIRQIAKTLKQ